MNHLLDQIVLLGDSHTEHGHINEMNGWCSSVQNAYMRKFDVINRGFSGYNSEHGKYILPQLLPTIEQQKSLKTKIKLLIIFYGANDAAIPPSSQHVPLEDYKINLKEMVNLIKSPSSNYHSPATKIILITPAALEDEIWNKENDQSKRTDKIMKLYTDACVDVANELNVPVVNIWQLIHDRVGEKKLVSINNNGDDGDEFFALKDFLLDGLHFTDHGCDALFDGLMKVIHENYPELDPANIPLVLPIWREIDPNKSLEVSLKFP